MLVKSLAVGEIGANCFILMEEGSGAAVIIDPGAEAQRIMAELNSLKAKLQYIIISHGHLDHISAVDEIRQATGAKVLIHRLDADCLTDPKKNLSAFFGLPVEAKEADQLLEDGQIIKFGSHELKILHTPGHTVGGICISSEAGLFSGDTLFAGSVGRTDFPGGSMEVLINSIREKLLVLDPSTMVYPGHGLATTIGDEKLNNPFL
ncbi:MAG TPA: MBL fold metallo-hydrolase [Verrucomicrobiae bacterium]|nr:MBL fold metallo-hydrolase [Verrucomicrobiae bacterium]